MSFLSDSLQYKSILWEVTWYHASGYIYICAIVNPREKKNGANIRTPTNDPAEKKTQADSGTQDRGYSFSQ